MHNSVYYPMSPFKRKSEGIRLPHTAFPLPQRHHTLSHTPPAPGWKSPTPHRVRPQTGAPVLQIEPCGTDGHGWQRCAWQVTKDGAIQKWRAARATSFRAFNLRVCGGPEASRRPAMPLSLPCATGP
jgi:hypothetical protein